jgi:hypothetical protein
MLFACSSDAPFLSFLDGGQQRAGNLSGEWSELYCSIPSTDVGICSEAYVHGAMDGETLEGLKETVYFEMY